jgi:hypothetical protein
MLNADPTAQVILKTQMAETQRKTSEFQAKMQSELQKAQQDYQIKVAQLEQKLQELQAKYQVQTSIDAQKNATQIALANINNAAKERIAEIAAGQEMDRQQAQLQHEQDLSAMEAIRAAEQDIRQHGLSVQQQQLEAQNAQLQQAAQTQQQAALAQQGHQHAMEQALQQQPEVPEAPQEQQPPQEEQ